MSEPTDATEPEGRARDEAKRRRVVAFQRWVLNPPMKLFVWFGLVPGHIVVETLGRRTDRKRRTVVGAHRDGRTFWVVAEQGRHAGWVRNLEANADVRVRHRLRWHRASASIIDGDDPVARMDTWGRKGHARAVARLGTQLTTVRLDLPPQ